MRRKRILFMIPTLDGGGAEKALVNLVNTVDLERNQVEILTLFNGGVNRQDIKAGVQVRSIFKIRIKGLKYLFKFFSPKLLYKVFVRQNYDVAVAYLEGECTRIISGASEKTKRTAWVHIERTHDYVCAFRGYREMMKAYSKFNQIILVSNDTKRSFDQYTQDNFYKKENIIKNVVDYHSILANSKKKPTLQKKTIFRIISVGRLTKVKDMDRLIVLFQFLEERNIEVEVLILGVGEEYNNLQNHINMIHRQGKIKLLGYQQNPYQYISSSDLYVCCSHQEGYSTTVLESVVLGIPVVTTNCSGMSEILQGDKCGIITEDRNEKLFEAVQSIILDKDLYASKKKGCIERSRQLNQENVRNIKNNHKIVGIK